MTSSTTDRRLGLTGGAAIKVPCKAATTASITLSGEQTVDGISCTTGNRVLVKDQTSSVDNGVYVVDTGTWTRDLDFDGSNDVVTGTLVPINSGSSNGKKVFRVTTTGTITFGSSALTFEQSLFSSLTGVTFTQAGTGAVERGAQDKMRESVSAFDFMTDAEVAAVQAYSYPDVTTAVQKAWDTGRPVHHPGGGYGISATLLQSTALHIGQHIFGDGCVRQDNGTGTNKTIFKPLSSSVTVALGMVGSGTSIRGAEFSDFSIDMTNMTDASTSIGIRQNTAFENKHRNITFLNEGTNKRSFKFEAGAYLTIIENCRGTLVELSGNSLSDAVTTLLFENCDFDAYSISNAAGIVIHGGAIQGSLDKLTLASVAGLKVTGVDIEGTGTYLVIGASCSNIYSAGNTWGGFTGTYRSGNVTDGWLTLLDSYATGSAGGASPIFSPTISFGGASVGVTYANQGGKYTKVGNMATVVLDLALSDKGSSTGNAAIGTLPFAGNANFSQDVALTCANSTLTGNVYGRISPSGTVLTLLINSNGALSNFTSTNSSTASAFRGTFTYFT